MDDQPTRVEPQNKRGGVWVTFGDEQYKMPSLPFRALQELGEEIKSLRAVGDVPTPDQMTTMEKVIHCALVRNYPDLTVAQVSGMLDLANFEKALSACLDIAGFKRAEGRASGESAASTGAASIAP